ncbi:hypothetical protein IKE67_07250 [bacterium]|nr:hypothetical protein [bacterium]
MKISSVISILNFSFFIILLVVQYSFAFEYGYTNKGFKYVIHQHSESSYQHAWCNAHKGIEEYENPDKTRVDCLTETNAAEFDFANKRTGAECELLRLEKIILFKS